MLKFGLAVAVRVARRWRSRHVLSRSRMKPANSAAVAIRAMSASSMRSSSSSRAAIGVKNDKPRTAPGKAGAKDVQHIVDADALGQRINRPRQIHLNA